MYLRYIPTAPINKDTSIMPVIPCVCNGCAWSTPDQSETIALAMFQSHEQEHKEAAAKPQTISTNQTDRRENVKKPPITKGCTPEDWSYFESRWIE